MLNFAVSLGTYLSLTLSTSDIGVCRTIHDHVPLKVVDDPIPDYRTHEMNSSTVGLKYACIFRAAFLAYWNQPAVRSMARHPPATTTESFPSVTNINF